MATGSKVYFSTSGSMTQDGASHSAFAKLVAALDDGTAADAADLIYYDVITVPYTSTPGTLNLVNGSLLTIAGDALVMREAVAIQINNNSTEEATVRFDFGSGNYVWTEPLLAGGTLVKYGAPANAYPTLVADGPHITITTLAGINNEFEVIVLGRSLS